jgi:hypothetical protein
MRRNKCLNAADKMLSEYNTRLASDLFHPNRVFVETELIKSKRGAKPRKMVPAFCPFCGNKLDVDAGLKFKPLRKGSE